MSTAKGPLNKANIDNSSHGCEVYRVLKPMWLIWVLSQGVDKNLSTRPIQPSSVAPVSTFSCAFSSLGSRFGNL